MDKELRDILMGISGDIKSLRSEFKAGIAELKGEIGELKRILRS